MLLLYRLLDRDLIVALYTVYRSSSSFLLDDGYHNRDLFLRYLLERRILPPKNC